MPVVALCLRRAALSESQSFKAQARTGGCKRGQFFCLYLSPSLSLPLSLPPCPFIFACVRACVGVCRVIVWERVRVRLKEDRGSEERKRERWQVMLKDLSDSKRLDNYVHSQSDKGSLDTKVAPWLDTKILSASFWPPMSQDAITMHSSIKNQLESYSRYYSLLKKPRGLVWRPTMGVTKITLTFDDGRDVQFTVAPVRMPRSAAAAAR